MIVVRAVILGGILGTSVSRFGVGMNDTVGAADVLGAEDVLGTPLGAFDTLGGGDALGVPLGSGELLGERDSVGASVGASVSHSPSKEEALLILDEPLGSVCLSVLSRISFQVSFALA